MSYSLFKTTVLFPETDKFAHILLVHERYVVNMTVNLSHQNHGGRYALLARTLWVRSVIILAIIVNFIPGRRHESAIRALGILWM